MEPIEDYFMGPVATCSSELLQAIDQVLIGNDPQAAKRKHMRGLSHQDYDNHATRRLLERVLGS
jgi:hypothetical protein